MAISDEVIRKNRQYLTQAQIDALVAAEKRFNNQNAGNRAGALATAREQYDTGYRGLQNMGLAGASGAQPTSGEVPRLQQQIRTPFEDYNNRLRDVERQRLGALGNQFAQQTQAQWAAEAERRRKEEAYQRAVAAAQSMLSNIKTSITPSYVGPTLTDAEKAARKAQADGLKRTQQIKQVAVDAANKYQRDGINRTASPQVIAAAAAFGKGNATISQQSDRYEKAYKEADATVRGMEMTRRYGGTVNEQDYQAAVQTRNEADTNRILDNYRKNDPEMFSAILTANSSSASSEAKRKAYGVMAGRATADVVNAMGFQKTMSDKEFNDATKVIPDIRMQLNIIDSTRNRMSNGGTGGEKTIEEALAELKKLGYTEDEARGLVEKYNNDRNFMREYDYLNGAYTALYEHQGEKPTKPVNDKETDVTYRVVNRLPNKRSGASIDTETARYMTDEQRDMYNAIFEKEGAAAANEFAKAIVPIVEMKRAEEDQQWLEKLATEKGFPAWLLARGANLVGSIPAMVEKLAVNAQNISAGATGELKKYSPNSGTSRLSNWADIVQSKQSQNILEYYDKQERPGMGKFMNFMYNTGTSMADSLIAMGVSGVLGSVATDALFFSSAGNQAYKDAIQRGATQEQAMGLSFLSGTAEALFEHVSLEKLTQTLKFRGKPMTQAIKDAFTQAGVEGSEELFTEIANVLSDFAIMKDKSEMQEAINNGELGTYLWDHLSSATLGGLASGLLFGLAGVGGTAWNIAKERRNNSKLGNQVRENSDVQQVKNAAVMLGGEAMWQAESVQKKETDANVGEMTATVVNEIQSLGKELSQDQQVGLTRVLDGAEMTTQEASDVHELLGKETLERMNYDAATPEAFQKSYNDRVQKYGVTSRAEAMQQAAEKRFNKQKKEAASRVWANPEQGLSLTTPEGGAVRPMPGNMTAVALAEQERTGFKTRASAVKGNVTYAVAGMEARQGLSNERTYAEIQNGLTKEARKKAQIYEKLADALGVKMVIHDVMVGTNGFIDEKGNMHVVLSGKQSVLRVAAHELTHFMKEHAGTEYASMREYLIGEVGQAKFDKLVKQKAKEYGLNLDTEKGRAVADDEVCAELCERMLSNEDSLTRFAEKDTKAAKTLKAHLLEILNAIKSAFKQAENRDFGASKSELIESQETLESWITGLQKAIENAETKAETAADEARAKQFQANEALYITEEDAKASRAQAKLQSEVEADIKRGTSVSGYDADTINGIIRSTLDTVGGETVLSKDALKQARARIAQTVRTAEAFLLDTENDAKQQALNDRTRQVATEIVDAYQATEGENAGALAELKDFLIGSDKTVVIGIGPNQMADIRSQYDSPMVLQGKLAKALGARVQLVGKTNAKYESAWKMDELYEQLREKYNLSDDQSFTSDAQNLVDFIDGIRQQDEGVTAGIGDSETREQAILDVQQALMDQVLKAAGAKTGVKFSLDTDSMRAQREYEHLQAEYDDVVHELDSARKKKADVVRSKEYTDLVDEVSEAKGDAIDAALQKYVSFMNQSGANDAVKTIDRLEKKIQQLNKQMEQMYNERAKSERNKAIQDNGLSDQDYDRNKAIKEYGYTPYFYDAGYMLPNGKLLNFSGEKGKHFGTRGEDHRGIGVIYDDSQGSEAMIRFMNGGNIRVMEETPGIDISNVMEPTREQYSKIRQFASESAGKRFFNVDISDENGNSVGALSYDGRVSPDRVVNDIKHYFATGEIRQQSDVSRFLYSLDTDYMRLAEKQKAGTLTKEDESKLRKMVDDAANAAGYTPVTRYHQTRELFNTFNTDNPVAGLYDSETPNGIFLKTNDHDIGIGGSIQMPLYLSGKNLLHFANREQANAWYSKNVPGYAELQSEMKKELNKFDKQLNDIEDKMFAVSTTEEEYDALDKEWNQKLEAMKPVENEYRGKLRGLLNDYFLNGNSGYDGIELDYDGHRWVDGKRENVHTLIAFSPSQVKSADPVTYDDADNIIPLSERFNTEKEDIRYDLDTELLKEIQQPAEDIVTRYSLDTQRKRRSGGGNATQPPKKPPVDSSKKPGYKPQGKEPRVRDVQVPERAKTGDRVSDFVRSFLESDKASDEIVSELMDKIESGDWGSYTQLTNEDAMDRAKGYIARKQFTEAQADFHAMVASGKYNVHTRALGLQLLTEAANRGDKAAVLDIAADLRQLATDAGQSLQIFSVMKELGGVGAAWYMQKEIDRLNNQYADEIASGKMNEITVDPELMQQLIQATTQADIEAAEDAIAEQVAGQLPLTTKSKIVNWRYLSMLGNPTTHFRNLTGNVFMAGLNAAKDVVATGIERAAVKDQSERAHAILNKNDRQMWKDIAAQSFQEQEKNLRGSGKNGFGSFIQQHMRSFDNKTLNAIARGSKNGKKVLTRNGVMGMLEVEDVWFLRPAYQNAFMQYMKAQGFTVQAGKVGKMNNGVFTEITTAEMSKAIDWASQQAWKATFRDASTIASILNSASKKLGPVGHVLIEGVMPFKKTPVNIAKRGIEYSPVGVIMGTVQMMRDVKKGKMTAAQAIDNIASGVVGTSLMALGMAMAKAGLLRAGGDDEKKEANYMYDTGDQTYALKLGDVSVSVSALAPAAIPLLMGAALYEAMDRSEGGADLSSVTETVAGTLDPFMEMSVVSSLNSALKNYNQNGIGGALGNTILTAIESYGSQFLPTVTGKVGQFIDPTVRTTKSSAASKIGSNLDYYARSLAKKVPGLEATLEPDINVWGRETRKTGFGEWALDFANKFILPVNVKISNRDAVDNELIRVMESTNNVNILPSDGAKYFTVKGQRYPMTAAQYTEFSKDRGDASYAALKETMLSNAYQTASDEQKANMLDNALSTAQKQVNAMWKDRLGAVEEAEAPKQETGIKAIKGDYSDPALYKVAASYPNAYDKAAKAKAKGVSPDTFLDLYDKKESYVGDDRSDYMRKQIMSSNLTKQQKELMDDLIISDKGQNPDYSSQAWFDVSMLGKTNYDKAKKGEKLGISPETYLSVYNKSKEISAAKLGNKKKATVTSYLDSLKLSATAYDYLMANVFGYTR